MELSNVNYSKGWYIYIISFLWTIFTKLWICPMVCFWNIHSLISLLLVLIVWTDKYDTTRSNSTLHSGHNVGEGDMQRC
jgi:hypothetical protein